MTIAFVLSGGASLGAVEVGMLAALRERDIRPDVIVGTSVGALNGAWLAGHPDAPIDDLAEVWNGIHRSDVFPWDPRRGFLAFAGRRRSLFAEHPLRELIERHVTFARLEDAPIPLHVVAVEVLTGREVLLSSGPAVDSVLASAALPALFDPVEIGGVPYMDGGVGNNTPISHAAALAVDQIWVLCAGYPCALTVAPTNPLAMAFQALTLLLHRQLTLDVERYEPLVELRVLPPLCPLTVSPIDFSHSAELIDRAYEASTRWLDEDHPPVDQARYMDPHDHPAA
ncbi:MAG TPA: patatin-like phospholipase family protein [Acidimicrobiia bacterium]|nr:patatin-like phospholipase family protein [Acidimicrobiia bacterium]